MCTSDTNMKYDEINRHKLQETSRNHQLEFLYGIGILVQVPIHVRKSHDTAEYAQPLANPPAPPLAEAG